MTASIMYTEAGRHERALSSPVSEAALFSSVLLAVDFTSPSLGAARWGASHVAASADATLAHVIPFSDADAGSPSAECIQQREAALAGSLRGFGTTLGLAGARIALRVGRASHGLTDAAREAGAALVVLGRRGNANRRRVGEPNVTERVARGSGASVLVVPEGIADAPRHVLAAVDDSPLAPAVLGAATRLAALHGCSLTVVHVLSPVAGAYDRLIRAAQHLVTRRRRQRAPEPTASPDALPKQTSRRLVALARGAVANGSGLEVRVGDPAGEIAATAAAFPSALVVVGMRGADGAPMGSMGSVARELLARASVPVLAMSGGGPEIER